MRILILGGLIFSALPATAFAQDGAIKGTGDLISWLLSTLGVVAFIFILAILVKKTKVRFGKSGDLEILSSLNVGPKERVVEIKAGCRILLLGVGPGNVRLLCDLSSGEDFKDAVAQELSLNLALNKTAQSSNEIKSDKIEKDLDDKHKASKSTANSDSK